MRVLRLIVAGLIAVAAVVGVFFAAVLVFVTGLVAYGLQLFRPPARPASRPATRMQADDAIDVVSTNVPAESPKR